MLLPQHYFRRIECIPIDWLMGLGVRAVLLDVDNTLTTHDNPEIYPAAKRWLQKAAEAGLRLVVVSNNHAPRVAPFARREGLDFECDAHKPLPGGLRRACRRLGVCPREAAVVGDQLFTDMLGGNLVGAVTILVQPIEPENGWFFRLKRALERPLLRGRTPRG